MKISAFLRHAPWWVISASVTLVFMGLATMVHFVKEKRKQEQQSSVATVFVPGVQEKLPELPSETKEIDLDEVLHYQDPNQSSQDFSAEPEIYIPEAALSNHNETASGKDDESVDGMDDDSRMHFKMPGNALHNSIGVGSGSSDKQGGKPGGSGGGRRNLMNVRANPNTKASKETRMTVLDGLKWLARHQSLDGSWRPEGFHQQCDSSACSGTGYDEYTVGTTGLALLAFLGSGFHHQSQESWIDAVTGKRVRVGIVIREGLKFLIEEQTENGAVGKPVGEFFYNHTIATLALTEAYGLSGASLLKGPAERALQFLLQSHSPIPGGTGFLGWRYTPGSGESDTSVTGWAVMAMKSAQLCGFSIPSSHSHGALHFIKQATNAKSEVGYLSHEDAGQKVSSPRFQNEGFQNHPSMTAVGMLVRAFLEQDVQDPALEQGARLLVKDLPRWDKEAKTKDYYYWYYASLALNQFDGPDSPRKDGRIWKAWNEDLVKALLPNQSKEGCQAGSWDAEDRWGAAGGRVYSTAINTLTLEVYYRYENAFGAKLKKSETKASR